MRSFKKRGTISIFCVICWQYFNMNADWSVLTPDREVETPKVLGDLKGNFLLNLWRSNDDLSTRKIRSDGLLFSIIDKIMSASKDYWILYKKDLSKRNFPLVEEQFYQNVSYVWCWWNNIFGCSRYGQNILQISIIQKEVDALCDGIFVVWAMNSFRQKLLFPRKR